MANKAKLGKRKGNPLKVSDRKFNKLIKRGKLQISVGKKSLLKETKKRVTGTKNAPETTPIIEENDIPLHEADYEYFSKPGRNYDFLLNLPDADENNQVSKKRKKIKETGSLEKLHAKRFKYNSNDDVASLPLVTKTSKVAFVAASKSTEDDNDSEEQPVPETTEEVPVVEEATVFQEFLDKKIASKVAKETISKLSECILECDTENVEKLPKIMSYLDGTHSMPIRKFAVKSLFEIFKDIIPDYKIRLPTDSEKQQKMKKDTKELLANEATLLTQYKKFVDVLDGFSKGQVDSKASTKNPDKLLQNKKILKRKSVEYLGELLVGHPHFNFRTEIIGAIVRSMFNHDSKTSDLACSAIKSAFAGGKCCEVVLEITRLIGRTIKAKHFKVKPKVLDTFLSLKIREIESGEDKAWSAAEMRKRNAALSRNERKKNKQLRYLEKELQQAGAEDDKKANSRLRTETISVVFLTYFRILKLSQRSPLLPSVLQGLAQFAHLINITYFDDLFAALTSLVDSESITNRECLYCIQTAVTLLIGQGASFNIDPFKFYIHFYRTLFSYDFSNMESDLLPALKCLDLMLNKRRRHLSDQRCMAFVKRISILLLQLHPSGVVPLLAVIKNAFRSHPKCDILLDTDSIGSGQYMPEVNNPDHCNPQSASLYELHLLKSSYDPTVATFASHILQGLPDEGVHKLPTHLCRILTTELFENEASCSTAACKPPPGDYNAGRKFVGKGMAGPAGKRRWSEKN